MKLCANAGLQFANLRGALFVICIAGAQARLQPVQFRQGLDG